VASRWRLLLDAAKDNQNGGRDQQSRRQAPLFGPPGRAGGQPARCPPGYAGGTGTRYEVGTPTFAGLFAAREEADMALQSPTSGRTWPVSKAANLVASKGSLDLVVSRSGII